MSASPQDLLKGTTPGPWMLKERDQQLRVVLPDGSYFFVDDLDQITDEERANARLISAAPDLVLRLAEAEALLTEKVEEIGRLRAFESAIFHAWDYAQAGGKGSKNPIIRARKLYRLVREALDVRRALKEAEA